MEYITLNNGIQMPVLGLGIYQLHGKECEQCILDAINMGYRLFDTAQMYGNEKELGNAIIKCNVPREELFITTKVYSPSTSYERTEASIKESLKALQLDYIDLLLIHEPYHEAKEMYRAMEEAYRDGLVRAIGISNFNSAQYMDFIQSCNVIPAINQVEAHVFYQQKEIQELMIEHGTQMNAWSPLAVGKGDFFRNVTLKSIGEKYGKSSAQIGLKHLVQRGIVVIPKTANKNRMAENIDIFDFQLSDEDISQIDALYRGKTLFGWYRYCSKKKTDNSNTTTSFSYTSDKEFENFA